MAELKHTEDSSVSGVFENCNNHIREKLVELLKNSPSLDALDDDGYERGAAHLIANGVTVQERNEEGCPYCDIAKANEGVVNTKLWVKEAETSKWTMMGKRLIFCPMCGRELTQTPEGE